MSFPSNYDLHLHTCWSYDATVERIGVDRFRMDLLQAECFLDGIECAHPRVDAGTPRNTGPVVWSMACFAPLAPIAIPWRRSSLLLPKAAEKEKAASHPIWGLLSGSMSFSITYDSKLPASFS